MVKVYDMDTYSLCALGGDAPNQATVDIHHADLPQTALGLQSIETTPAQREPILHPALRYTDVKTFLATLDD